MKIHLTNVPEWHKDEDAPQGVWSLTCTGRQLFSKTDFDKVLEMLGANYKTTEGTLITENVNRLYHQLRAEHTDEDAFMDRTYLCVVARWLTKTPWGLAPQINITFGEKDDGDDEAFDEGGETGQPDQAP